MRMSDSASDSNLTLGKAIFNQIRAVGSVKIFLLICESFKAPPHIFFMKEQFSLYQWRKEFFLTHFPLGTWVTTCNFGCGKLGFEQEGHYLAALHYNITVNFDYVLELAVSDHKPEVIRFPTDFFSDYWTNKFEWNIQEEEELLNKLSRMEFSRAIHVICTLYGRSPPSLLQIAMKKVLEHGMSLTFLPRELQVKAVKGLYYREGREAWDGLNQDEWPDCLSEKGTSLLRMLISRANHQ